MAKKSLSLNESLVSSSFRKGDTKVLFKNMNSWGLIPYAQSEYREEGPGKAAGKFNHWDI